MAALVRSRSPWMLASPLRASQLPSSRSAAERCRAEHERLAAPVQPACDPTVRHNHSPKCWARNRTAEILLLHLANEALASSCIQAIEALPHLRSPLAFLHGHTGQSGWLRLFQDVQQTLWPFGFGVVEQMPCHALMECRRGRTVLGTRCRIACVCRRAIGRGRGIDQREHRGCQILALNQARDETL